MKRLLAPPDAASPGFQIAPMIDVVFVIMLFFMAMAASLKEEHRLSSTLPSRVIVDPAHQEPPTEIGIGIGEDGEVSLNDEVFGRAGDPKLPVLLQTLQRLRERGQDAHQPVLVTIEAEPQASYQRIMEVLNVLAVARLPDVTFAVGTDWMSSP